jgi:uncharacterized damage-inducible protein DinB
MAGLPESHGSVVLIQTPPDSTSLINTTTMTIAQQLLAEFTMEADTTRRVLERIPDEHLSWRAHPTARSLGELALHLAQTPMGVAQMAQADSVEVPDFKQTQAGSRAEVLAVHEQAVAAFRDGLQHMSDERILAPWSLTRNGKAIWTVPRVAFIRGVGMNHLYHHRGQITLCLRMLGIPVPSIYGASRDENPFA